MRKIDSGSGGNLLQGAADCPLVTFQRAGRKGVKGGGTPLVLPLTLCDMVATYPTSSSCSIASRCLMFMYFLLPHCVPAT